MRKAFTFYGSYYQSIKQLPPENQHELYKAIIEYSFEKIEPKLNGISSSIWYLIKPNLDNNIARYESGKSPKTQQKKAPKKRKGSESKAKAKQSESDALSLSLSISLNNKYYKDEELNILFIEFLEMRKKLKAVNSERAINLIMKKLEPFDDEDKKEMIKQSIESSWKSVYELKKKKLPTEQTPTWFDSDLKKEELSEEERKELEDWSF